MQLFLQHSEIAARLRRGVGCPGVILRLDESFARSTVCLFSTSWLLPTFVRSSSIYATVNILCRIIPKPRHKMSFQTTLYYGLLLGTLAARSAAQDYPDTVEKQNEAGAEGPSSEGVGMTSTGMIVLCTIVGVVVVVGGEFSLSSIEVSVANCSYLVSSAALFIVAKKRQWAMREAIRRSARQVGQAIKTPLTPRFPRSQTAPKTPQSATRPQTREERYKAYKAYKARKETDLEKNALVTEKEPAAEKNSKSRTWGSYFSFGR